jgi:hypothetical protein
MSWFRSNRCGVTWLALFALTCQLVLSFGHVHPGKSGGFPDAWAVAANAGDNAASLTSFSPYKNPAGIGGDFCTICASIGLASTLVVPASPAVVPPIAFVKDLPWSFAAVEPASFDHLLFNARAPPHA